MAETTDPKHRSRHLGSLFFSSNRENAMLIKRFLFDFMVYDMFSIILQLGEELEVAVNACCVGCGKFSLSSNFGNLLRLIFLGHFSSCLNFFIVSLSIPVFYFCKCKHVKGISFCSLRK